MIKWVLNVFGTIAVWTAVTCPPFLLGYLTYGEGDWRFGVVAGLMITIVLTSLALEWTSVAFNERY